MHATQCKDKDWFVCEGSVVVYNFTYGQPIKLTVASS